MGTHQVAGMLCAAALTITGCSATAGSAAASVDEQAARGSASQAASPQTPSTTSVSAAEAAVPGLPPVPQVWAEWPTDRPLFPELRLVGYCGYPGAPGQGRLGIGDLDQRVSEIVKLGDSYGQGRRPMPVLELIAVTVQAQPGRDGKYRYRTPDEIIKTHLIAARKVGGLLLLNVQPGRADFLTEAKALEKWLLQPDVALALDPEWRMGPGEVPMRVFGHVTGKELNSVAGYLSGLVAEHRLPPKVMLYHQLNPRIVRNESALLAHPGVELIKAVDGIGSRSMKEETWKRLTTGMPSHVHAGFKLFYQEDREHGPLMTPAQVLALTPTVDYVLYE